MKNIPFECKRNEVSGVHIYRNEQAGRSLVPSEYVR